MAVQIARQQMLGVFEAAKDEVREERPDLSGNAVDVTAIAKIGDGNFERGIERIVSASSIGSLAIDRELNQ